VDRSKQPLRKVLKQGKSPCFFVTLPPELGIKHGDEVIFKIEGGKIILEKVETKEVRNERI